MSIKHGNHKIYEEKIHLNDWQHSRHTKAKFKEWLGKAPYDELLKEYEKVQTALMWLRNPTKRFESQSKGFNKGQDNISILKYKYSLLTQKLLLKIGGKDVIQSNKKYYHS